MTTLQPQTEVTAPRDAVQPPPPRRSLTGQVLYRLFGRWGARVGLAWIVLVAFLAVFAPLLANSHPYLWRHDGQWSSPLLEHLGPADVVLLLGTLGAGVLWLIPKLTHGARLLGLIWWAAVLIPLASWKSIARSLPATDQTLYFTMAIAGLALVTAGLGAIIIGLPWKGRGHSRLKAGLAAAAAVAAIGLVLWPVDPPSTVVYSKYREAQAAGDVSFILHAPLPFSPLDRLHDAALNARLLSPGFHPTPAEIDDELRDIAEDAVPDNAVGTDLVDRFIADAHAASAAPDDANAPAAPDPATATASARMVKIAGIQPDTRFHPMGTTAFGEDMASRMIHACRIALAIGFIATAISVVIGVVIGGLMGYFSGWVDLFGMRLVEIFASIPVIYLLIAIVAFWGRNLYLIMVIIGLTGWVGYALFVRAEFLKLRQQDYVTAARAGGLPLRSVLFKHMLPNGITPVLVTASFGIAGAIMTEATLSFLGLGLVEEPSWGQLLQQARSVGGSFYWWIALYPGAAIFLTVFAYNLIGEALRDALDPRTT